MSNASSVEFPLQLQSVGDIIGKAVRICRTNAVLIFSVLLTPTIFMTIAKIMMQWGLTQIGVHDRYAGFDTSKFLFNLGLIGIGFILSIFAFWFFLLRQLAIVRLVNGFDEDYPDAIKNVQSVSGKLIRLGGVYIASGTVAATLWVIAVVFFAIIGKANPPIMPVSIGLIMISCLAIFCFYSLLVIVMFLTCISVVCDSISLGTALKHCLALSTRSVLRVAGFGILLLLTFTALSYTLSLPLAFLAGFEFFRHGITSGVHPDPMKVPLYYMVVAQAWESLIHMVVWPIITIAFGLFYQDLRMRQEGFDLLKKLELQS